MVTVQIWCLTTDVRVSLDTRAGTVQVRTEMQIYCNIPNTNLCGKIFKITLKKVFLCVVYIIQRRSKLTVQADLRRVY